MKRLYINPLPVRIWHWTNAVGFVLLIATGLQIRYADLMGVVSFETAVRVHNVLGFVLMLMRLAAEAVVAAFPASARRVRMRYAISYVGADQALVPPTLIARTLQKYVFPFMSDVA